MRSHDAGVRLCAARALMELEWTAGSPDLEQAVRTETTPAGRTALAGHLAVLKAMAH